jgi:hypothetical protein
MLRGMVTDSDESWRTGQSTGFRGIGDADPMVVGHWTYVDHGRAEVTVSGTGRHIEGYSRLSESYHSRRVPVNAAVDAGPAIPRQKTEDGSFQTPAMRSRSH